MPFSQPWFCQQAPALVFVVNTIIIIQSCYAYILYQTAIKLIYNLSTMYVYHVYGFDKALSKVTVEARTFLTAKFDKFLKLNFKGKMARVSEHPRA